MKNETKSLITPGTSLIYPYFNTVGKLCSVLYKDGEFIRVEMSPTEVVDDSMKYFGTSLRGGIEGGKAVMGDIHMTPVMVNERLDMYLFPSKSPSSSNCVWFQLSNILIFLPIDKSNTKVILHDGTVFRVDCSYSVFHSKYQRACMLKNGVTTRVMQMSFKVERNSKTYFIRRNDKHGDFEVTED